MDYMGHSFFLLNVINGHGHWLSRNSSISSSNFSSQIWREVFRIVINSAPRKFFYSFTIFHEFNFTKTRQSWEVKEFTKILNEYLDILDSDEAEKIYTYSRDVYLRPNPIWSHHSGSHVHMFSVLTPNLLESSYLSPYSNKFICDETRLWCSSHRH